MAVEVHDIEKGGFESAPLPTTLDSSSPLATLQHLIGKDSSDNTGLYGRTVGAYRAAHLAYLSTEWIMNSLFMLQIILAATFTALSAYKDTMTVVLTVLGAVNTVVAGALAWQKGQGVPQRYRKAQDDYRALLEDIHDTERAIGYLNPHDEAVRLQKLYKSARDNQQANYPDLLIAGKSDLSSKVDSLAKRLDNNHVGA